MQSCNILPEVPGPVRIRSSLALLSLQRIEDGPGLRLSLRDSLRLQRLPLTILKSPQRQPKTYLDAEDCGTSPVPERAASVIATFRGGRPSNLAALSWSIRATVCEILPEGCVA